MGDVGVQQLSHIPGAAASMEMGTEPTRHWGILEMGTKNWGGPCAPQGQAGGRICHSSPKNQPKGILCFPGGEKLSPWAIPSFLSVVPNGIDQPRLAHPLPTGQCPSVPCPGEDLGVPFLLCGLSIL